MKFSDEERKEVAKKLRDKHKERNKPLFFEPQDMGIQAFNYLKDLQSCLPDADSTFIVIADLVDPEPEQTFDEWLKDVNEKCYANMECCDEPEWSLFSTIHDAIRFYLSGKSGYVCKIIDYDEIDRNSCSLEYDTVHLDYKCSKCGEVFETGMYCSIDDDDNSVLKDFKHCPNCGRKVIKK